MLEFKIVEWFPRWLVLFGVSLFVNLFSPPLFERDLSFVVGLLM